MSYANLKQRMDAGGVVILDGGIGTELQRRGAPMDPAAWCGPATLHNDKLLTQIHADYIAAGAEVATANTYASSRLMLSGAGLGDKVEEINRRAVEAAIRARDAAANPESVVVAGSLSHMVPVARGTAATDPDQLPGEDEMSAAFHELAEILAASGCELIILEMMYSPLRTRLALQAALSTGLPVWFGMSVRRGANGGVVSFEQAKDLPLEDVVSLIPASGIDAAGIMHSHSELVSEALSMLRVHFGGPLMAYPDSGHFEMPDWQFVDVIPPETFEEFCREWMASGVQVVGGCCGLTPEHIQAAVRARNAIG
ncbi:MAG: homocysteine S-methyltransferase family protein [Rhodovibrionaceae bacterium]|nr:homocysteine S-methyltransferase family protein [Rhodovibrionaceae bacterium]